MFGRSGFKAGSAYIEIGADAKKLVNDLKKSKRDTQKQVDQIGKGSAKAFRNGFDGKAVAKKLSDDIRVGSKVAMNRAGKAMGLALKGGLAAAGVASVVGVIGKAALNSASDMKLLADQSGVTAERFQELAYASKRFGFEQRDLRDLLVDMNDRIGDFASTGAGPLADFFENIAPKVGLTIDNFRNLSSDQALGLYIKALEDAGANSQDFAFYMEALSSRSTDLIPLFRDNGRELNRLGQEARDAGIILSNEAAQGAFDANAELERLGGVLKTGVTNAIVEAAPQIEALTETVLELVPPLINWASKVVEGFNQIVTAWENVKNLGIGGGELSEMMEVDLQKQIDANNKEISALLTKANLSGNFVVASVFENQARGLTKVNENLQKQIDQMRKDRRTTGVPFADFGSTETGSGGGGGGGGSGIVVSSTSDKPAELSDNFNNALNDVRDRLNEIEGLKERSKTALQDYQAVLSAVADGERLGMVTAEEASRIRSDALIELSGDADSLQASYDALAQAVMQKQISAEDAARVEAVLMEETQAKLDKEIQKRVDKNDLLLIELERKRELAGLARNETEVERLDREILKLREKNRLIEAGATDSEAATGAENYASQVDTATLEGKHKEAFRQGVENALGELGPALDSMFDAPISSLANALFDFIDAFKGIGKDGGGSGGGLIGGIAGIIKSFDGGGYTWSGPRSGGLDGKGGRLAMLHPNETVIDHSKGMPRSPSMNFAGGSQLSRPQASKIQIVPSKYFDVVVDERSAAQAVPIAQAASSSTVAKAGRNTVRRQSRQL